MYPPPSDIEKFCTSKRNKRKNWQWISLYRPGNVNFLKKLLTWRKTTIYTMQLFSKCGQLQWWCFCVHVTLSAPISKALFHPYTKTCSSRFKAAFTPNQTLWQNRQSPHSFRLLLWGAQEIPKQIAAAMQRKVETELTLEKRNMKLCCSVQPRKPVIRPEYAHGKKNVVYHLAL